MRSDFQELIASVTAAQVQLNVDFWKHRPSQLGITTNVAASNVNRFFGG